MRDDIISHDELNAIVNMLEENVPIQLIAEKTGIEEISILKIQGFYFPDKFESQNQVSSLQKLIEEQPVRIDDDMSTKSR